MRLFLVSIAYLSILFACSTQPGSKVSAHDAVKVVQESKSVFDGADTAQAIANLLALHSKGGRHVEVTGWSQGYRPGGTRDVWFKVKVNDKKNEYHWVVDPDGTINPANDLAQSVTLDQRASAAN